MATLQNLGVLKYRDKSGNWEPLPVVLQSSGGGGSGGISTISGKGQPTESTVGRLNQLYRDESTDKLYICTGVEGGYTWAAVVSDTEDAATYTAQTLTEEQKTQARANIGAGTSNFSGSYNDLTHKPNIPAAFVIDTTLTKSGQAADAKATGDAIKKKLDATALPTAVNNALAQAKASGEFDGAKGDKGDTGPEGPKGDTGPVGPKGADGKDGAGMDVTGAKVGQIAKITAVDTQGKPTEWEPVDMPSGGAEEWEKIAEIVIPEGAAESNKLTIDKDMNGEAFRLVKTRLCSIFPPYTGESDIPRFSFAMINGKTTGKTTPLAYTSAWDLPSKTNWKGSVYEVDVSEVQQIERSAKPNISFNVIGNGDYVVYGPSEKHADWVADTLWAKPITSIGGTQMLIYSGCRFILYGVRE